MTCSVVMPSRMVPTNSSAKFCRFSAEERKTPRHRPALADPRLENCAGVDAAAVPERPLLPEIAPPRRRGRLEGAGRDDGRRDLLVPAERHRPEGDDFDGIAWPPARDDGEAAVVRVRPIVIFLVRIGRAERDAELSAIDRQLRIHLYGRRAIGEASARTLTSRRSPTGRKR